MSICEHGWYFHLLDLINFFKQYFVCPVFISLNTKEMRMQNKVRGSLPYNAKLEYFAEFRM